MDAGATAAARNTALFDWYRDTARSLPWRGTNDPYSILVSEVMLQQTQAMRVVPYYERFLDEFPDPAALAAAPLGRVLELWSGLGYNARAKRLREAARLVAEHGWPIDVAGLRRLPGVGPYTAAAIASFAFGEHVPAVDTNLRRVLSRWHGEELDGRTLHAAADAAIAEDGATWNQAMMDLGARVCLPRAPRCAECPVSAWCPGPETYRPPRRQARFEGSTRQLRGAVVRHLVRNAAGIDELARSTGFQSHEVAAALDDLAAEGLVGHDGSAWTIAD